MDKKEGGESQLDVGGKNSHRLSPINYTSIAEIKGFRFKFRKYHLHPREKSSRKCDIKSQAGQRRNPQRPPQKSQSPRSDDLTLPEARL